MHQGYRLTFASIKFWVLFYVCKNKCWCYLTLFVSLFDSSSWQPCFSTMQHIGCVLILWEFCCANLLAKSDLYTHLIAFVGKNDCLGVHLILVEPSPTLWGLANWFLQGGEGSTRIRWALNVNWGGGSVEANKTQDTRRVMFNFLLKNLEEKKAESCKHLCLLVDPLSHLELVMI